MYGLLPGLFTNMYTRNLLWIITTIFTGERPGSEAEQSWASRLLPTFSVTLWKRPHTHKYTVYTHIQDTSWNVNWTTQTLWLWRPLRVSVVKPSNWMRGSGWGPCGQSFWTQPPGRRRAAGSGSSVRTPWAQPPPATRWWRPPGCSCAAGPPGAAEHPRRCQLRTAASTRRSRAPRQWWFELLAVSASGPPGGPGSV